jgi:uncharacterized protein DUF4307
VTDLSARYGTSGRPRWLWPLVAVMGIGIGVAWAAWVAFQPQPVSAKVFGYDVVDDHHVDVTLDVHRPDPQRPARCTVYAQAQDHAIVGEKTVTVPADPRENIRVQIALQTERRAVTGVLRTCETSD